MKLFILALAMAMLAGSAMAAEPRINTAQVNWTQTIPSGEGIIFSGTAPGTTTNALYSDGGTLKFNGEDIGKAPSTFETFINTVGTTITEFGRDGTNLSACQVSDAAGIETMIEHAIGRGGTIFMGPGTYNIGTGDIDVPNGGQTWRIEGAGRDLTIIQGNGTNIFFYPYTTTYRRTGTIASLTIDGSSAANGLYMYSKYCWTTLIDDCAIQNCNYAIYTKDTVGCYIYNVKINTCTYGIYVYGSATNATTTLSIMKPNIDTITNSGIYFEGAVQGCFVGPSGVVELTGNRSIYLYRTVQGTPSSNLFQGLWLEQDDADTMICLSGTGGTTSWYGPRGNIFQGCSFHTGSDTDAIVVQLGRKNTFRDMVCYGSTNNFDIENTAGGELNRFYNFVSTDYGQWVMNDFGTSTVKTDIDET